MLARYSSVFTLTRQTANLDGRQDFGQSGDGGTHDARNGRGPHSRRSLSQTPRPWLRGWSFHLCLARSRNQC